MAALFLVGPAGAASAGTIGIRFSLAESTLRILGGAVEVPPDGDLQTTTTVIRFGGDGPVPQSGPASAAGFGFTASNISGSVLGQATVTGNLTAAQVATAGGTLGLNGSAGTLQLSGLALDITAFLGCAGSSGACASLGLSTPIDGSGQIVFTAGALPPIVIQSIGVTGAANFSLQVTGTLSGLALTIDIVGNEIQRNVVPEPGSFSLAALGLAGLAAFSRSRRPGQSRRYSSSRQ